jgi:hypothetical protein
MCIYLFIYFQTNLSSQQSLTQEFSQWTVTGIPSETLVTGKNTCCVMESEGKVWVPSFILNWNVAESKKLISNLKCTSFSNQKKGKWTPIIQIDMLVILYTKQFAFICYCQILFLFVCVLWIKFNCNNLYKFSCHLKHQPYCLL